MGKLLPANVNGLTKNCIFKGMSCLQPPPHLQFYCVSQHLWQYMQWLVFLTKLSNVYIWKVDHDARFPRQPSKLHNLTTDASCMINFHCTMRVTSKKAFTKQTVVSWSTLGQNFWHLKAIDELTFFPSCNIHFHPIWISLSSHKTTVLRPILYQIPFWLTWLITM